MQTSYKNTGNMKLDVAQRLCALNEQFYAHQAASFSQTRNEGWPGWERVIDLFFNKEWGLETQHALGRSAFDNAALGDTTLDNTASDQPLPTICVVDVACGNLRFAQYLARRIKSEHRAQLEQQIKYYAVDSCESLVSPKLDALPWPIQFQKTDLIYPLLQGQHPELPSGSDVTVCFGFFHHIPTVAARIRMLKAILNATCPGGLCVLSLWQFALEPSIACKAIKSTQEALASMSLQESDLEAGDFILGWQNASDAWRYCHHFDEEEICQLIAAVEDLASVEAQFKSDGRNGHMNTYLVFRTK